MCESAKEEGALPLKAPAHLVLAAPFPYNPLHTYFGIYNLFEFYCNHQLNELNPLRVLIHAHRFNQFMLFFPQCALILGQKKEFLRKQGPSPQY